MRLANRSHERPRELRRRVILPARLRTGTDWSDTCILNVSSRGLMIQSARPALPGSLVELRRGDHVIVATVMWRQGSRLGLQADNRVPVEEIMSSANAASLRLVASDGALIDRRRKSRTSSCETRLTGRTFEFVALIASVAAFAGLLSIAMHQALNEPLKAVQAALSE